MLGKKECLWLLIVESGIGKLSGLLLLVLGGSTLQTKSSRGRNNEKNFARFEWPELVGLVEKCFDFKKKRPSEIREK